ncbi:MAG: hypothetical protein F4137_08025 [Acidobacteria bacterium]|nr:hypothetical protein [Acidobacteriota bacterium]MYH28787.1 hypothetical protein [Acidobacteriota bacterium]
MKDLVALVADKDMEHTLAGLLSRPLALGIRPIHFDVCINESPRERPYSSARIRRFWNSGTLCSAGFRTSGLDRRGRVGGWVRPGLRPDAPGAILRRMKRVAERDAVR